MQLQNIGIAFLKILIIVLDTALSTTTQKLEYARLYRIRLFL